MKGGETKQKIIKTDMVKWSETQAGVYTFRNSKLYQQYTGKVLTIRQSEDMRDEKKMYKIYIAIKELILSTVHNVCV